MRLVKFIAIKRNKVQLVQNLNKRKTFTASIFLLNRPIVYIYLPGAHSAGKFNLTYVPYLYVGCNLRIWS